MAVDEVVRPLELDAREAFGLQRARDGDADGERQPRQEARALLEAPAERKREAAAGDRGPGAAAAAAAGGLPFGGQGDAVDIAPLRRGAGARDDVESIWSTTSSATLGGTAARRRREPRGAP